MKCYFCRRPLTYFFTKNGYRLFRCSMCGLVQTHLGKPYTQFLKDFYTTGYFTGDDGAGAYTNYAKDKPNIVKNMGVILERIKRIKPTGTLLDAGCAYGYFVELALTNGFDAYGFDPSAFAVSQVPTVLHKRIAQHAVSEVSYKKQSFDVISMLDVFEHLADPVVDLERLHKLLKDDGIIIIATGDTDSLAAKVLKRRWTFYVPPQHLFFFNKKTITQTLDKAGFAPILFFRIGKWLSLSYMLHLAQTTGESRVAAVFEKIIDALHLGSLPLYLPMGDNMVVIARKT
ncbi:MAG: Methyltransferase type 12 [Microgenomates group bacterium GW2011_GWC1_43_11]|uniref:Methyltransferase type 12 n=1 Tax=Candidatus Gottesmanbacteria bacterium GW2011_GWB1_44_11c TaxID=1618447 RepID=A0A0G1ITJ5_9BACT|nr:MAG: Methyltransferase type 12 [Microgenomates group bacterium GW2011_GWC1_43_11]KKT35107.1 MAG: Methyltransferase type 12 [Candidatus Gottesmanbacteria bacterium GW2011_GWB1_44_11c]